MVSVLIDKRKKREKEKALRMVKESFGLWAIPIPTQYLSSLILLVFQLSVEKWVEGSKKSKVKLYMFNDSHEFLSENTRVSRQQKGLQMLQPVSHALLIILSLSHQFPIKQFFLI